MGFVRRRAGEGAKFSKVRLKNSAKGLTLQSWSLSVRYNIRGPERAYLVSRDNYYFLSLSFRPSINLLFH